MLRGGPGRPVHEQRDVVAIFAGGGTGGHLYPALSLAEALVELRPDVRPFFVGAARGLEARVLPERGVEHLLLPVRGIARTGGGNWTVAAQIGAAYYLLANLDEELAAEKALEWYDSALQGRDDDPLAGNHVSMRDYIQARENIGGD